MNPPPRRDVRWIMIVLGICLVILAILLLSVGAIVSSAVSGGCGSSSCSTIDPGLWFDWLGLPILALGSVLLIGGIWWAIR